MRSIALRASVALILMAAATPALADPMFTATDLGAFVGEGLNDSGQVVGQGLSTAAGAPLGLHSGGVLYDAYGPNAGTLYAFTNLQPTAINDSGVIVGAAVPPNLNAGVFGYGTAAGLFTPIQSSTETINPINTINASGQSLIVESNPSVLGFQTFIYNPNGTMLNIGTPPGQTSFTGTGINDSGQVVGYSGQYEEAQATIYSGGAFHSLGTLPGYVSSVPVGIDNAGQVAGNLETNSYTASQPFLYSNGVMQALGTLGGPSAVAQGISSTGEVYGYSVTADGSTHAFLYVNGQMIDLTNMLHSLTGSISQYSYYNVQGFNSSGQILVLAQNSSEDFHSFLLTPAGEALPTAPDSEQVVPVTIPPGTSSAAYPAPEPSGWALFMLTLAACGARRGFRSRSGLPVPGLSTGACTGFQ